MHPMYYQFPHSLMQSLADKLLSPEHGDIEFVFTDDNGNQKNLYASSEILTQRSDYYKTSTSLCRVSDL
jgi:hypothetical protein